jgi:SAM-dependent methyltransferase
MKSVNESISKGHYAKKQILCKDWLISWSHRSRFEIGLRLARQFSNKRVLDFGCGDGTFLAMLMASPECPSHAIGIEVYPALVEDCQTRLGHQANLKFQHIAELNNPEHQHAYDAIICMEVLEHIVDVKPLLDSFARLLTTSGKLLISVPVETGLPLLVKQAVRRIAGWRGIGDYPGIAPYTFGELLASVFAGRQQHITRPVHKNPDGIPLHDHKGFNWMALREKLEQQFILDRVLSSPIERLSPHLASQVWFEMRKKP